MLKMIETMRSSMFMPHGMCFLWQPGVLWLHAVSDTVIAVSYFLIPLALIYLVRHRRDIPFNWMIVMFGVFILGCGTTHVMAVWTLWWPNYWIDGFVKASTASASVVTAALSLQSHLESSGRHIPIVFVTAFTDDNTRIKALQAGAICFLAKPFREGDLLDGVRSALRSEDHA